MGVAYFYAVYVICVRLSQGSITHLRLTFYFPIQIYYLHYHILFKVFIIFVTYMLDAPTALL